MCTMKCEDIKIYPTGNGTLQIFIIPYTHIKSTAKLLLLIMTVIDYEKMSDKIKKMVRKTKLSERNAPHEICTTDFLSR